MPFAVKPYVSEATRFLQELKSQRPELEAEQKKGRSIWWDHPQDADLHDGFDSARVRQKAYVYGID